MSQSFFLRLPDELILYTFQFLRGNADPIHKFVLEDLQEVCKRIRPLALMVACSEIGVYHGRTPPVAPVRHPKFLYDRLGSLHLEVIKKNLRVLDLPAIPHYAIPPTVTTDWIRQQYVIMGVAINQLYNLKYLEVSVPSRFHANHFNNIITIDVLSAAEFSLYHLDWEGPWADVAVLHQTILPKHPKLRSLQMRQRGGTGTSHATVPQIFPTIDSLKGSLTWFHHIVPSVPSLHCLTFTIWSQSIVWAPLIDGIRPSLRGVRFLDVDVVSSDGIHALLPLCPNLQVLVIDEDQLNDTTEQINNLDNLAILIVTGCQNYNDPALADSVDQLCKKLPSLVHVEYHRSGTKNEAMRYTYNRDSNIVNGEECWRATAAQLHAFRYGYLYIATNKKLTGKFPAQINMPKLWLEPRRQYQYRAAHLWVNPDSNPEEFA